MTTIEASEERWNFVERPGWTWAVTSRDLASAAVHRWFYFPHSFAPALVTDLLADAATPKGALLLDPFVGAGTAMVAVEGHSMAGIGCDISPLAVYATRVKCSKIDANELRDAARRVERNASRRTVARLYLFDDLVHRAFPEPTLSVLEKLRASIGAADIETSLREALMLALLAVLPRFSRLVRKGGWLSEVPAAAGPEDVHTVWRAMVESIAEDASKRKWSTAALPEVVLADARRLPYRSGRVDAVITSPPYPNRHDYTRVFGVELAFGFLDGESIKALRYQSMHSHPEAKPNRPPVKGYEEPSLLTVAIDAITPQLTDARTRGALPALLHGYFRDLYHALVEVRRVLKPGGWAALVVGNARYAGTAIPTDALTADIAEQAGLQCSAITVARRRGNSAQQMAKHGREAQRESVVQLTKP